jgi:hypothetical protein
MFADLDTSKEYFKLAREDKAFESIQKQSKIILITIY